MAPATGQSDQFALAHARREHESFRRKGVLLKTLSIVVLFLGLIGYFAIIVFHARFMPHGRHQWIVGLPPGIAMGIWMWLYPRGKRYLALSAQELLEHDPRPPVVYLRSFKDDVRYGPRTFKNLYLPYRLLHPLRFWASLLNFVDIRTAEEMLAEVLLPVGPVVAIGRPSEKLPQLGAARVYVGYSDWQQTIEEFVAKAALVVLRLGQTPGFLWELEHAATHIEPRRLILLVPLSRGHYQEFCARAAKYFPKGLPAWRCSAFRRLFGANLMGNLRALIWFQPDWTPIFVDLARVHWPWKNRLRMLTRRDYLNVCDWALQPVFRQLDVPWKPPRFTFRGVLVILYKSVPLLLILAVVAFLLVYSWLNRVR